MLIGHLSSTPDEWDPIDAFLAYHEFYTFIRQIMSITEIKGCNLSFPSRNTSKGCKYIYLFLF